MWALAFFAAMQQMRASLEASPAPFGNRKPFRLEMDRQRVAGVGALKEQWLPQGDRTAMNSKFNYRLTQSQRPYPSRPSPSLREREGDERCSCRQSRSPLVKGRGEAAGIGRVAGAQSLRRTRLESGAKSADKPGSVVDSHSSRRIVADTLKQPTRRHRGPRHSLPIWSCSRWGLPCRSVTGLAVRSYRTISPLPRIPKNRSAVSFCCTFRRLAPPRRYLAPCPVEPGLSSAFFRMTRLPGRLRANILLLRSRISPKVRCANFGPRSTLPNPRGFAAPPYQGGRISCSA